MSAERRAENLFHSASDPSAFLIWGVRALSTKVRNSCMSFLSIFIEFIIIGWERAR